MSLWGWALRLGPAGQAPLIQLLTQPFILKCAPTPRSGWRACVLYVIIYDVTDLLYDVTDLLYDVTDLLLFVAQAIHNIDELFDREELSASPDAGWPDCFNSGVFVYKPSIETYSKLLKFAVDKGSFDGESLRESERKTWQSTNPI